MLFQPRTSTVVVGLAAALAGAGLARLPVSSAPDEQAGPRHVVEIRSYNLKPGTRQRYHDRLVRDALPLLARWKVDVVSFGPSMHDDNSYFLMRAYSSLAERQKSEDAFYGSDEWKNGIRDAVLADIENYTTIVINADEATLRGLRKPGGYVMRGDLEALTALNEDYIRSVQGSDVKRFDEILADDFLCSQPDGSL